MPNPNHPKTGTVIKADPIRRPADIKAIKKLLAASPRDLAIFVLGINTNLRASDLVGLTVGQVRGVPPLAPIKIREQKTKKPRLLVINPAASAAVADYLATRPAAGPDEPLFIGQRGAMTAAYLSRLVKSWCRAINLKGNYSAHSLRKTWGYHQRLAGANLPTLVKAFNHATQRQTMQYLGIVEQDVLDLFATEL